jgi:hypothetical protein
MLLRHICRPEAAARLEKALTSCDVTVTGDRTGATCAEYAEKLMELL